MLYLLSQVDALPATFLDTCRAYLPPWRLEQANQYRFPADQKLNAAAYLLLVAALRNEGYFHTLPEFGYHSQGKPFLLNYPGLFFNLSHCPGVVACALSGSESGVDVEKITPYDDELARHVCSPVEYEWLSGFRDPEEKALQFTLLWTRKESVMKYLGSGLNLEPREIACGCPDPAEPDLHIESHIFPGEGFCLSCCHEHTLSLYHEDKILSSFLQPAGDLFRMGERPVAHTV